MNKIILWFSMVVLPVVALPSHAELCMEGYDDGSGHCILFDRNTAPLPESGLSHPVQFGPDEGDPATNDPDNYYSFDSNIGMLYYTPEILNNPSQYPYAHANEATGDPDSSATAPSFWCNAKHASELSTPPSPLPTEYGWAYSNYAGADEEHPEGLCNVLITLKTTEDADLSAANAIFGDNYSYDWIESSTKLSISKAAPTTTNGVELGIAQSNLPEAYGEHGLNPQPTLINNIFSSIYHSGVNTIRIPVGDVPLFGVDGTYPLGDTSQEKFEDTIKVLRAAKNAGLQVLVGFNPPGNVNLPRYYDKSFVDVIIEGDPDTVITNGQIHGTTATLWNLPATVTIGSGGTVTVQATSSGIVPAAADTLIHINTTTSGWTSVTNPEAANTTVVENFTDQCWGGGTYSIIDVNNATGYTYAEWMENVFQRFVAEEFDNIIGFEIGNEIDTVCYNADIPFDGDTTPVSYPTTGAFDDSAAAYAGLLNSTRTAITNVYPSNPPALVTFGMTSAYWSWAVANSSSSNKTAWDAVNFLAAAFTYAETYYSSLEVDALGYHLYPSYDVDGYLDSVFYPELNPVDLSYPNFPSPAPSNFNKPAWITEWGFEKRLWPGDRHARYRAMVEVMEHLNGDSAAGNVTKAFLYDYIDIYDHLGIATQNLTTNTVMPNMPESRVLKLYTRNETYTNSGVWTFGRPGSPSANPNDSDSDGLSDTYEIIIGTQPLNNDSDDDGLLDSAEDIDSDSDGLSDVYEVNISETDTAKKDSDDDGLTDDWELITLPGTNPVDLDNPNLFFNALGEPSSTRQSDTIYDYHEFYFDGDSALVASKTSITSPTDCEVAIEFWKPVNWSGKKVLVHYHPGGWQANIGRDEYGKQITVARSEGGGGWGIPGPYTIEFSELGNITYWLDNDYAVYVPSYRGIYEESDCAGTANSNALVTWEEVVHDAQESFYHIVLTSKMIADEQSTVLPQISILGLSAGGHLAGVLTTHGLDQLGLDAPEMPWDGIMSQGRTAISSVLSGAGPSHVKIIQDHLNNNPFLAADRPLNLSDIDPPSTDYVSEVGDFSDGYTTLWCGEEGAGDCTIANFKALPATAAFIAYNTLGNYYSSTYSPRIMMQHGTADNVVAPEESAAFCRAVATASDTQSSFDQTISLGNVRYLLIDCDASGDFGSKAIFIDGFPHYGNYAFPYSQDIVAENYFAQNTVRRWIENDLFDQNDNDISDSWEKHYSLDRSDLDSDGDEIPNDEDSDNDNDGVSDLAEYEGGSNPRSNDTDGDSVLDNVDNCRVSSNNDQIDRDGDELGDACDRDDDSDTVLDVNDSCQWVANSLQLDRDDDDYGNACDGDVNNDDVVNSLDLSILVSTTGYGGYSSLPIFPGTPAITIPYLNKTTSEIDQNLFYQWVNQGSAYSPGPSGLYP